MRYVVLSVVIFIQSHLLFSQTNTWLGGISVDWHNAANWGLGHVPLATEDVLIDLAGGATVGILQNSNAIAASVKITSGGKLVIRSGASLTVDGINSSLIAGNGITLMDSELEQRRS